MSKLQTKTTRLTPIYKYIHSAVLLALLLLAGPAHAVVTVYDVASRTPETDVFGYDGESLVQSPDDNSLPTNAFTVAGDYADIAAVDGAFHSYTSNSQNHFVQMRFEFQIDEAESDVSQIEIAWTGNGDNTAMGKNLDGAELYIWNYASSKYESLDSYKSDDSVVTLTGIAAGAPADYLGGAGDDTVTVLVESTIIVQIHQQYTLRTDHVSVTITSSATAAAPFGFNCVATGSDPIAGTLYTRLVGAAFGFDLAALMDADSNGVADAVETSYAGGGDVDVTLELIDTSSPVACAAYPSLSPAEMQTVTFSAADSGRTSASMTVNKAYRSVGCRVTDAVNSVQGCSTDSFAIRPTGFSVSSNMSNAGSSGAPVARAGDAFTLSATAVVGYDGAPSIDNGQVDPHAGAVQAGNVGGAFGAANPVTGIATGNAFQYSEVGNFRVLANGVYDDSFTAVDQPGDCTADFSNSLVGGKVGCKFGNADASAYFGRFTPDHFIVTTINDGALQAACNGFSYSGQTFGYVVGDVPSFTIIAENGLATPATTQNYTGAYNKLSVGSVAIALTSDASNLGADGLTPLAIAWTPGASLVDDGDGTLDFDLAGDSLSYVKEANAEVGAVTSDVDLVFSEIRDSDDILASGMPLTLQPAAIGIRFGRLAMDNAYGSELLDLPVPLRAEYYAGPGAGYVSNTLDVCTTLAVTDLTLASAVESGQTDGDVVVLPGKTSQASIANAPFASGQAGLSFCPPGSPTCTPESGNTGSIDIQAAAPAHLQYDWDADGIFDDDPGARASFGLYQGNAKQIYLREVY